MQRSLLSLLLLIFPIATTSHTAINTTIPLHADDLSFLHSFSSSISSSFLSGWTNTTHPCEWFGVECFCDHLSPSPIGSCQSPQLDSNFGLVYRVLRIDFGILARGNRDPLLGSLPDVFPSQLFHLILSHNSIFGPLSNFTASPLLELVILPNNNLSGGFPNSILDLKNLRSLDLSHNNISGLFPDNDTLWCSLSNLASLNLENNENLCGVVPQCLSWVDLDLQNTLVISSNTLTTSQAVCNGANPMCFTTNGNSNTTLIDCHIDSPTIIPTTTYFTFTITPFVPSTVSLVSWSLLVLSSSRTTFSSPPTTPTTHTPNQHLLFAPIAINTTSTDNITITYEAHTTMVPLLESYFYTLVVLSLPPFSTSLSFSNTLYSSPIFVDPTAPIAGIVSDSNCPQNLIDTTTPTTSDTTILTVCWSNFTDPQSGIDYYLVRLLKSRTSKPNNDPTPVIPWLQLSAKNSSYSIPLPSLPDESDIYYFEVRAVNPAGLHTTVQSGGIVIQAQNTPGNTPSTSLVVAIVIVVVTVVGVFWMLLGFRPRSEKAKKIAKFLDERADALRTTLQIVTAPLSKTQHGFTAANFVSPGRGVDLAPDDFMASIRSVDQLAFVITDIQGSTALSESDPDTFQYVQDIHDAIIREAMSTFGGYEIATQGDSFEIAFFTIEAACSFCMRVQKKLMDTPWPRRVLSHPSCRPEVDPHDGRLIMHGPRIRMGLHWASPNSFTVKLHDLTKSVVFGGFGFRVARELSDVAFPGQILLSGDAWNRLRMSQDSMREAGFPLALHLGGFELPVCKAIRQTRRAKTSPKTAEDRDLDMSAQHMGQVPLSVQFFQLDPPIFSRSKPRRFPPPDLPQTNPARGFHIAVPPKVHQATRMAIVSMRFAFFRPDYKPSQAMYKVLAETVVSVAQLFHGYTPYHTDTSHLHLVFSSASLAVRFALLCQVALLYAPWDEKDRDPGAWGREERRIDAANLLFSGPRVAIGIHVGDHNSIQIVKTSANEAPTAVTIMSTGHAASKASSSTLTNSRSIRRIFSRSLRRTLTISTPQPSLIGSGLFDVADAPTQRARAQPASPLSAAPSPASPMLPTSPTSPTPTTDAASVSVSPQTPELNMASPPLRATPNSQQQQQQQQHRTPTNTTTSSQAIDHPSPHTNLPNAATTQTPADSQGPLSNRGPLFPLLVRTTKEDLTMDAIVEKQKNNNESDGENDDMPSSPVASLPTTITPTSNSAAKRLPPQSSPESPNTVTTSSGGIGTVARAQTVSFVGFPSLTQTNSLDDGPDALHKRSKTFTTTFDMSPRKFTINPTEPDSDPDSPKQKHHQASRHKHNNHNHNNLNHNHNNNNSQATKHNKHNKTRTSTDEMQLGLEPPTPQKGPSPVIAPTQPQTQPKQLHLQNDEHQQHSPNNKTQPHHRTLLSHPAPTPPKSSPNNPNRFSTPYALSHNVSHTSFHKANTSPINPLEHNQSQSSLHLADNNPRSQNAQTKFALRYAGAAVSEAHDICDLAHGGQIVISESAWEECSDTLPPQTQVIHLGLHKIRLASRALTTTLVEVMPLLLSQRDFPPVPSIYCMSPGYRESPSIYEGMAIVFCKVFDEPNIPNAEFLQGVGMWSALCRELLLVFDGYECKEPDPGKFTLAFSDPRQALAFCCTAQSKLIDLPWSTAILAATLQLDEDDDNDDNNNNSTTNNSTPTHHRIRKLASINEQQPGQETDLQQHTITPSEKALWRGLRVCMGMAYGHPISRKPLATGRADYYGALPNLAARVLGQASPGQVLFEGEGVDLSPTVWTNGSAVIRGLPGQEEAIVLRPVCLSQLKGLDTPKVMVEASVESLLGRKHPLPKGYVGAVPNNFCPGVPLERRVSSILSRRKMSNGKRWLVSKLERGHSSEVARRKASANVGGAQSVAVNGASHNHHQKHDQAKQRFQPNSTWSLSFHRNDSQDLGL